MSKLADMSALQKKACAVLVCCVLALAGSTVGAVALATSGGGSGADSTADSGAEDYNNSQFQINTTSSVVLAETADAGTDYLNETVFVGDSNTVRMYNYGLITLGQFVGQEGLGIEGLTDTACVTFKGDNTSYTIPQAIAKMKPRRIVVTLGTNNADGNMTADEFVNQYKKGLAAIVKAYPYCDIIVNAVPPVPQQHSSYPSIQMQTIDEFNQALVEMCETEGYSFLNSSEVLKGTSGYGKSSYFMDDDIHMKTDALKAILTYVRGHALISEDRRPDTDNLPIRTLNGVEDTSASSTKTYTVSYYVDQNVGGKLECDKLATSGSTDEISLQVKSGESVTVTAVPDTGYEFYTWSDGNTDAARTDEKVGRNISVKAVFKESLSVSIAPSSISIVQGDNKTLTATVTGEGASANKVVWSGAGNEVTGQTLQLGNLEAGEYTVTASITVKEVTQTARATVSVQARTYMVQFDSNGSTTSVESQQVTHGKTASNPGNLTRTGYTFDGWFNGNDKWDFGANVTGDMTLTAKWTANNYTITLNPNNGQTATTQTVPYGGTVSRPADPTQDGYTFDGWFNGGGAWDFGTTVTSDLTLTGRWTQASYTVNMDANGGSGGGSQTILSGGTVSRPADPTRSGYIFDGWYNGDSAWNFSTRVTENLTLTARWTAEPASSEPASSEPASSEPASSEAVSSEAASSSEVASTAMATASTEVISGG